MFTGIIQTMGAVKEIHLHQQKGRMTIETPPEFGGFQSGESIAVNGVCLTVAAAGENSFAVDMSTETLDRTTFKDIAVNAKVNLERSLTPNQKMSGHFVMGHVDRVGRIVQIDHKSGEVLFRFEHPPDLQPYLIEKGSVAVDGISLTVFSCSDHQFTVSMIPYTMDHTNLHERKIGDRVNLECDMIGKYVYRACEAILGSPGQGKDIALNFLKRNGSDQEKAP